MDFHPLNILALDGRFTGVVDWAGAAAGDRRADLARTEVTMATAPIPPGPMRPVLAVLRRLMLRGWREGIPVGRRDRSPITVRFGAGPQRAYSEK
jgi:aminoglycoside phosphotransferase (APT) family kinase protein